MTNSRRQASQQPVSGCIRGETGRFGGQIGRFGGEIGHFMVNLANELVALTKVKQSLRRKPGKQAQNPVDTGY